MSRSRCRPSKSGFATLCFLSALLLQEVGKVASIELNGCCSSCVTSYRSCRAAPM